MPTFVIYCFYVLFRPDELLEDEIEREESLNKVPRSLNSDISYFGVGGKQAIFYIGSSCRVSVGFFEYSS